MEFGIISYMIVKVDKDKFIVTDFILSCRVFKRFIEETIIFFVKKQFKKKPDILTLNQQKKTNIQRIFENSKFLKN